MDYDQTSAFITDNDSSSNPTLLSDVDVFHEALDSYNITVPNFYNIIGCTEPTILGFNVYGNDEYDLKWGLGDGTVPGASTNLPDNGNNYFALGVNHIGLVSDGGTVSLMQEIIDNTTSTNSLPWDISTSSASCSTYSPQWNVGWLIASAHSPIALNVYDSEGDHTGPNASGTIDLQIPGSQYETIGDNTFIIVPASDTYNIVGQGLSSGSFTLKVKEYDSGVNLAGEATYVDVPLASASTTATLTGVSSSTLDPDLSLDVYGNGTDVEDVPATALLNASSAADIYPPTITVSTSSIPTSVTVGATTTITFSFSDTSSTIATSSATFNGTPFTSGQTLTFSTPGTSTIEFFAEDDNGNPAMQEYDVTVLSAPPSVSSFSASPSSTISGASSTLSWNVTNALSVAIMPGSFSTSTLAGSFVVNPTSTTVYTLTATSPNGTSTATTTVTVTTPTYATSTYAVGEAPDSLAFDPHTDTVWVANYSSNTVTQINDATFATSTYPTGSCPQGIAFDSHTDTVWVANACSNTVTVFNDTTHATSTYKVGSGPSSIAFDPHTDTVWVADGGSNNVMRFNDTTYATSTYKVGSDPVGIAFDSNANTLWVADYSGNTLTQINDTTYATSTHSAGSQPNSIAFDPHTDSIWVTNGGYTTATEVNDTTFATSTYTIGLSPTGLAFDPHTDSVWVAYGSAFGADAVTQMNDTTYVTSTYAVGANPAGVVFDSDTNSIWVANDNSVTVFTPSE